MGVVVRVVARHVAAWRLVGLQGYRTAWWRLFYYRHNCVNF
jgi:hypothetical protein